MTLRVLLLAFSAIAVARRTDINQMVDARLQQNDSTQVQTAKTSWGHCSDVCGDPYCNSNECRCYCDHFNEEDGQYACPHTCPPEFATDNSQVAPPGQQITLDEKISEAVKPPAYLEIASAKDNNLHNNSTQVQTAKTSWGHCSTVCGNPYCSSNECRCYCDHFHEEDGAYACPHTCPPEFATDNSRGPHPGGSVKQSSVAVEKEVTQGAEDALLEIASAKDNNLNGLFNNKEFAHKLKELGRAWRAADTAERSGCTNDDDCRGPFRICGEDYHCCFAPLC